MNKPFSIATEVTIAVQAVSLLNVDMFNQTRCELMAKWFTWSFSWNDSHPCQRFRYLFKKVLANILKFRGKFKEKQFYLKTLWKILICLVAQLSLFQSDWTLLMTLAKSSFLEYVQVVFEPIMFFWIIIWFQNSLLSSKQLLRSLSGKEGLFFTCFMIWYSSYT